MHHLSLRHILLCMVFFLISIQLIAQDEISDVPYFQKMYTCKNRIFYGGAINFQSPVTDLKVLQTGIQPQFGGFVVNNFAVAGILPASYGTNGEPGRNIWNVGGGAELRYFIGWSSVKFYVYGNAIPHYVTYQGDHFGIMAGGGPGVAFFTSGRFSINLALYGGVYRIASYDVNQPVFAFNLVFNGLFLTAKEKSKIILEEYP